MPKQTIAVDIDDVLSASAAGFVAYTNAKWGTSLGIDDYDEDWVKLWQVDHATGKIRAHEYYKAGVVNKYENFDEALPVLKKLSGRYDLVIATSRVIHVKEDTLEWLDRHYNGVFSAVHLAGIYDDLHEDAILRTKADLCKAIGANYLIDDQPKHCVAVAEIGITGLLFGDYSWNRRTKLRPGMARVRNWQQVAEYFDGQPS